MRYKPRSYWEYNENGVELERSGVSQTTTVFEQDRSEFSGLYNEHGERLYKEREPVGYRIR